MSDIDKVLRELRIWKDNLSCVQDAIDLIEVLEVDLADAKRERVRLRQELQVSQAASNALAEQLEIVKRKLYDCELDK